MTRVISIANHKGGCGKTTTSINLAACLAAQNKTVLLIDMDPQGHSGSGLKIKSTESSIMVHQALSNGVNKKYSLNDVIVPVNEYLDIAPSDIGLSTLGQKMSDEAHKESKLKKAINGLDRTYDYILIDCPPNLGFLTFNALFASTEVIIPIEMSFFSLHGTSRLLEVIELVRTKTGHNLRLRVLATMFDKRTRISREVLDNLKSNFGKLLFDSVIHSNVKLREAASYGMSIVDYDKRCVGYEKYLGLAKELIAWEKSGKAPMKKMQEEKKAPLQNRIGTRFAFHAPSASSIKVVGNFNNWTPTDDCQMKKEKSGMWSKTLDLEPGTYQYKFIIDEVWVEDKTNPKSIDSPFGGRNSIIKVG